MSDVMSDVMYDLEQMLGFLADDLKELDARFERVITSDQVPQRRPGTIPAEISDPRRRSTYKFAAPIEVRKSAMRGIILQRESKRRVGPAARRMAKDLSEGKQLPVRTLRRMVSYFKRTAKWLDDRQRAGQRLIGSDRSGYWGSYSNPSSQWLTFLMWGGRAGWAWANRVVRWVDAPTTSFRGRRLHRLSRREYSEPISLSAKELSPAAEAADLAIFLSRDLHEEIMDIEEHLTDRAKLDEA